jgi:hypothetical protein
MDYMLVKKDGADYRPVSDRDLMEALTEDQLAAAGIIKAKLQAVSEGYEDAGGVFQIVKGELTRVPMTRVPRRLHRQDDVTSHLGRELTAQEQEQLDKINQRPIAIRKFTIFGGLHIRDYCLERAGDVHQGHKHFHDHVTYLHSGKVLCSVQGCEDKVFEGPIAIPIKAELFHRFTALSDDVHYSCIFAWRDGDGEITDVFTGDQSPYDHAPTTTEELVKLIQDGCKACVNNADCCKS